MKNTRRVTRGEIQISHALPCNFIAFRPKVPPALLLRISGILPRALVCPTNFHERGPFAIVAQHALQHNQLCVS
jgi:hypothetical protein